MLRDGNSRSFSRGSGSMMRGKGLSHPIQHEDPMSMMGNLFDIALLIAGGSIVGGQLGARVGRRLPAPVLRLVIIAVGLVAEARLLLG